MAKRKEDLKKLEELRAYYDKGDFSALIEKGEEVPSPFTGEDYKAWKKTRKMKQISLRLPEDLIAELKVEAMKQNIGYQTLIRQILTNRYRKSS
ncbi:MAG: hypothetical protein DRH12_09825 [Deltaproteobacteria bacterium]|nr:MAG: hypothetical protein DRH12_09825 [Deltaproteobacteria bacterium]